MHGFVEVGMCRNDPCGQVGPRHEDGFCSEDCRMETTGCSIPFCGCGGACDGVSRCSGCERYTWGVVGGRCLDCREDPAITTTIEVAPDVDAWRLHRGNASVDRSPEVRP